MKKMIILALIASVNAIVPTDPGMGIAPDFITKYIETYKNSFVSYIEQRIDREIEPFRTINNSDSIEYVYKTKNHVIDKIDDVTDSIKLLEKDTVLEYTIEKTNYTIDSGSLSVETTRKFGVGTSILPTVEIEESVGFKTIVSVTGSKTETAKSTISLSYPVVIESDAIYNSMDDHMKELYSDDSNGAHRLKEGEYSIDKLITVDFYYSFKVRQVMTYKVKDGIEKMYYPTYVLYGDTNRFIVDEEKNVSVRKDIIDSDVNCSFSQTEFSYYELNLVKAY